MLRKGRNGAQKQVLWQNAGEKAAQHLAPEVSNLAKFQPVDINNLQFMLLVLQLGIFWHKADLLPGQGHNSEAQGEHCTCRDSWHCSTEQPHEGYSRPDAQSGGAEGTALFQHCQCMEPVVATFPALGALFGSEGQAHRRHHLQDDTQTPVRAHDTTPYMLGSLRLKATKIYSALSRC